jgi:hypothetical protein
MNNIITQCPCCGEKLHISALQCSGCGVEIKNEFEPSKFDTLGKEQRAFLFSFLKNRGNMKTVQNELGISYPTAKKKLDDLLESLDIAKTNDDNAQGSVDMSNLIADSASVKASEIIKAKLIEHGGRIIVHTARGLPCEIIAHSDGKSFITKKLPVKPAYEYKVFDVVVDVLLANGGRARKGNGRNYRLGHPECNENTVVGAIALNYAGKKLGDSVFDPVFVLAAVLEWAGIASNERGELVLTQSYRSML